MPGKPEFISASQIGQYVFCPLSYRYLYIDGYKKSPHTPYTLYGTALHETLAHNYRQKIASEIDLSASDLFQVYRGAMSDLIAKHDVRDTKGITQGMEINAEMTLQRYMAEVAPKIQPLLVEHKFELQLKNYPITILGYIDLVTVEGWIIDHKSAGKTWKRDWTQDKVDDSMQLTMYSAAYRKMFGKAEAGVRIDVLPRVIPAETLSIESYRTDGQVTKLLQMATDIDRLIDMGIWVPNLNSCSACPFKDICPKQPILPPRQS